MDAFLRRRSGLLVPAENVIRRAGICDIIGLGDMMPGGAGFVTAKTGQTFFSSSTTWTCPAGVYAVDLFLLGAGGGAEIGNAFGNRGGGGGGFCWQLNYQTSPGQSYPIAIGLGGASNQAGGGTSFDNRVYAYGGSIGGGGGFAGGAGGYRGGHPSNNGDRGNGGGGASYGGQGGDASGGGGAGGGGSFITIALSGGAYTVNNSAPGAGGNGVAGGAGGGAGGAGGSVTGGVGAAGSGAGAGAAGTGSSPGAGGGGYGGGGGASPYYTDVSGAGGNGYLILVY